MLPSEVDGVVAMEEHHGNGVSPASEETGVGLDVEPDDASEAARREERVVVSCCTRRRDDCCATGTAGGASLQVPSVVPPQQVKFLVPNVAAGSIIGKGGANITEIQTQSNARMQVGTAAGGHDPAGSERLRKAASSARHLLLLASILCQNIASHVADVAELAGALSCIQRAP